jgi:Spy/CpxP family protein refolding chaperone
MMKSYRTAAMAAALLLSSAGFVAAQTPSGDTPAQSGAPNSNNPNAPAAQPDASGTRSGSGTTMPRANEPMTGNTGSSTRSGPTAPPDPAGTDKKRGPAPSTTPGG